jgi:RNA polymerase sigma-70 factor (ECF subfamily)
MQWVVAVDALRAQDKVEADALLAECVRCYRPLIERLCRILLGDSGEAEDAAQQTFLLAYQSLLAGTRPHRPRAWLCTIARRECWARDHRRRRERLRVVSQAEERTEPDPAEQTVLRAELASIGEGLGRLPARQRQALVLRELAGLSYTQVAAALEVSESAAEALLVRARRSLRDARLALVLLLDPRQLGRLLRRGSGHARTAVGVQAAKAVAVASLVTATAAAVAGSGAPVERTGTAFSPRPAERTSPAPRHVAKAAPKPVARHRRAVFRPRHSSTHAGPRQPVTSAARVQSPAQVAAAQGGSIDSGGSPAVSVAGASTAPSGGTRRSAEVHASPPAASQPRAPAPKATEPPATPQHSEPPPTPQEPGPAATTPTPPTSNRPTPEESTPPKTTTTSDTSETPTAPAPAAPAGPSDSSAPAPPDESSNPSDGKGDSKNGNGYGDENHDHKGDDGKHDHDGKH